MRNLLSQRGVLTVSQLWPKGTVIWLNFLQTVACTGFPASSPQVSIRLKHLNPQKPQSSVVPQRERKAQVSTIIVSLAIKGNGSGQLRQGDPSWTIIPCITKVKTTLNTGEKMSCPSGNLPAI